MRKSVQDSLDLSFRVDPNENLNTLNWREIWSDTPCIRLYYAPVPTNTGKPGDPYKWRESRLYMKPDYRLQGWRQSEWEQVCFEYCAHDTKPDIIAYDQLSEPYGDRMYKYIKANLTNRGMLEDGSHCNFWTEEKGRDYIDLIKYTNIYNIISESAYGYDKNIRPID